MEKEQKQAVLTKKEAAQYLGVCEETVRRELCRGKLLGFKAGSHWRVTREELDRYMRKSAS